MFETGQGADQGGRLDRLCAEIEAEQASLHVPGLGLCVVDDGQVLLARGFGLAAREPDEPAAADTLFQIGSTTKAFTATLIASEVAAGGMAWDDPVTRFLPDYRLPIRGGPEGAEVTLRDLLCHRTGFTRTDILWVGGEASREQILAASLTAEPWADFRSAWHYNNVMFLAAGEALAAATGKQWETLLQERLLGPLGMRSTTPVTAVALRDERHAQGYVWEEERGDYREVPIRAVDAVAPAGAIWSNAEDMAKWLQFLLAEGEWHGEQRIGVEALRETWSPQMEISPGTHYGLGWMLADWRGRRMVQHGGNVDGFSAMVALLPEEGLGFALLCNASVTPLQGVSLELVFDALLGEEEPAAPAEAAAAGEDLAAFAGEYEADFGPFQDRVFEVRVQDGKLGVDVPGQMFFTLRQPDADGRRAFEITDTIAVEFVTDAEGRARAMRMHQSGLTFVLPRRGAEPEGWTPPPDPAAETFQGIYRLPGSPRDWILRAAAGRLSLAIPGETEYELAAADADGWRSLRALPEVRLRLGAGAGADGTSMEFDGAGDGAILTLERAGPLPDAGDLPTIAELERRFGEAARSEALQRLGGMRMRGRLRFVHGGAAGSFTLILEPGGRARHDLDLGPFGRAADVVDARGAGAAWGESSFEPYRELTGAELRQSLRGHEGNVMTRWAAGWDGAVALRVEELEGVPCAVVGLLAEGRTDAAWYDLQSMDLLRLDTEEIGQGGLSLPVTFRWSDYREVGGLRIPFRSEAMNDAVGRIEMRFEEVETGLALTEADFARPAPPEPPR